MITTTYEIRETLLRTQLIYVSTCLSSVTFPQGRRILAVVYAAWLRHRFIHFSKAKRATEAVFVLCRFQENFDIRAQARWKLERAIDEATKAKRWDALGVAAFALGELLGGDDAVTAAGALMLHQVKSLLQCNAG